MVGFPCAQLKVSWCQYFKTPLDSTARTHIAWTFDLYLSLNFCTHLKKRLLLPPLLPHRYNSATRTLLLEDCGTL